MKAFLIGDYCRIDGLTGEFAEKDYAADLKTFDREISLHSARNQMVSFQLAVVVDGEEQLKDFEIEFSPLVNEAGRIEPDYEVFIEWFHQIGKQLIPDMLIPYGTPEAEFRIPLSEEYHAGQRAGALWIDLFVPEVARKGNYEGEVTVRLNDSMVKFVVRLKVESCMVPYESRIIADLNNYADNISPNYPQLAANPQRYRDGSYFEIEKQFITLAREHRCLFQNLNYIHSGRPVESFAPELEGEGKNIRVKSWELFDRHFGPYLDGSAFAGSRRGELPIEFMFTPFNLGWPADYTKWGEPGFKTEYKRILWEFLRHFEEKGWTKTVLEMMFNNKKEYRFFPTTQDEIWYFHDEEIVDQMYEIVKDTFEHSPVKMVMRADSSNNYGNHYEKYADVFGMWVAAMAMYSWFPESVLTMKYHRNILWIYGWYGEGMTIDLPLHAFLTQPMICFMTGATGFCSFWNTLSWGKDYLKTPFVNGGQGFFYPGDGFHAGDVLPSLRMKVLRNQMQLADLMMTTEGLDVETPHPMRKELEEIVNQCFGYQGMEDWWNEKPPYLNTPPRYWNFEDKSLKKNHYENQSPILIDRLRNRVLDYLG